MKVCGYEAPVASWGEVNGTGDPASDTTVWGALSSLVQVTVAPVFIVSVAGLKAKFLMVIAFAEPDGEGVALAGCGGLWLEAQPAQRQASTSITVHAVRKGIPKCGGIYA